MSCREMAQRVSFQEVVMARQDFVILQFSRGIVQRDSHAELYHCFKNITWRLYVLDLVLNASTSIVSSKINLVSSLSHARFLVRKTRNNSLVKHEV